MYTLRYILTLFTLLLGFSFCQGQTHRCAWDVISKENRQRPQSQQWVPRTPSLNGTEGSVSLVTIPVVFHVIHDGKNIGNGENINSDLIYAQLEQLNDDFRRLNSDRYNTPNFFLPFAADVEIEFCLATQDTNGFATDGILRYNFGIPDYDPDEFKHIVQSRTTWNRDAYLNIWVADIRGYLGYAFLPGGEAVGDGLVLDYITVGSLLEPNTYNTAYKYGRTATHEIGHWLGLDHHWAVANDCFTDDGVQDTPQQYSYYLGKPNHPQTSCNSTDMFMNFLDYVDDQAMNLYTTGQKNVMHYTLNLIRSGIRTSNGCQPPSPTIMFADDHMIGFEGTQSCAQNTGLKQRIEMQIASSPNGGATIHLLTGGTAVQGVDYHLSKTSLYFPGGSNASQYFDITWSPDAYIEDHTYLLLDYSISGNSNARKGNKKQQLKFEWINDDLEAQPLTQLTQSIGTEMGSAALASPFRGSKSDGRMQSIYTAQDLLQSGLQAGYIKAISYDLTQKRSTRNYENFNLKLALTNLTGFSQYSNFAGGLPSFFSGTIFTIAGELKIQLDQPFYWDGHSNLIIETCFDNTGSSSDDIVKFENTQGNNTVLTEAQNGSIGCTLNNMPTTHSLRPRIKIDLEYGMGIATQTNTNSGFIQFELGPYKKVYFTDEDSDEVMLYVENLTGHDYGCTKVEIDRAGTSAHTLWSGHDVLAKSFHIEPEVNHRGGRYEIGLFFSKDEIEGWENTNQKFSSKDDLFLIKSSGSIGNATIGNSESIDGVLEPFGEDYLYRAQVKTGFSGFSLSNWQGGFLALEQAKLEATLSNSTVILNLGIEGSERSDSVAIIRTSDHNTEVIYRSTASATQIEVQDQLDHNGVYEYQALITTAGGRTISSNIAQVTLLGEWTAGFNFHQLEIQNSDVTATYTLIDLQGKILQTFLVSEDEYLQKDMSMLSSGLYMLVRKSARGIESKKLALFHGLK